ncbi:MAG: TIGR00730 family Rossman fold protein [Verrucomicrobiae bacterium]|nr:TIGR00730 family Rossman fold protein [Verrucomicrobiae bacterium]
MKRLCVFCGSSPGASPKYADAAWELGTAIASRGIGLVYGGAHLGLMGLLADAVLARGGTVTGVLPRFMADRELAHPGLSELHLVDTMHERKQIMARMSDGFVAMPGGFGTFEEIFESITWGQLRLHESPCAFLNVAGYYDPLREFLRRAAAEGFVRAGDMDALLFADSVGELFSLLEAASPGPVPAHDVAERI